jgi:riboflavin kinase / FMN adenylyltransferase
MQVHKNINELPLFKNAVVTIGTFDGVHTGHAQILSQLKAQAQAINGETVIITFNPHPRKVVANQQSDLRLINTLAEKIELLQNAGINHLVIVPFTDSFAMQPALQYIENFLIKYFKPHTIIIGFDHRFGHNREGNYQLLEALKTRFNYSVSEIPQHVLENSAVSSTKIRQAIINGQISTANQLLGYNYFFEGQVIDGDKRGRTIGYPTANIRIADTEKLVPGNGVYAVKIMLNSQPHYGMMNIGVRPTVDGSHRTIEVHIFNFNENIYGQNIRIYIVEHLRGEIKFDGIEALKKQLDTDKENSIKILGL